MTARHLVYHPSLSVLYLVDELSSEVTAYQYVQRAANLTPMHMISALPTDFTDTSTAAEIAISSDGRYVYVSNRGHDSIAAFGVIPGGPLIAPPFTPSAGQHPRFMTLAPGPIPPSRSGPPRITSTSARTTTTTSSSPVTCSGS
ncbi:MAG: lactonase family protein [Mycobacterium sp.]